MPATADYLAEHPFADPDQVNPPEAPEYVYRPDINALTGPGSLAAVDTDPLGVGSRIDIIVNDLLQVYELKGGMPTGSSLEVVPDDFNNPNNLVYWLLMDSGGTNLDTAVINFTEIEGVLSVDQLPPGSIGTLDSIGVDALYFFDDASGLPVLINSDDTVTFLNLEFGDIGGTLTEDQLPPGLITSIDSIDEDALYFFNNTAFAPMLIGAATAQTFILPVQTGNTGKFLTTNGTVASWATAAGGGGNVSNSGTPTAGQFATWVDSTHIQGTTLDADLTTLAGVTGTGFYHVTAGVADAAAVGETGTGNVVRDTSALGITNAHFKQLDNTTKSVVFGSRFTDTSPVGFMLRFMNAAELNTIFNVTVKGEITTNLDTDGLTGLTVKRFTDTTPTGNFMEFKNAANTTIYRVDITGTLAAGIVPEARISYTDPNANSIRIWDDTDNAMVNAVIGTNLTYTHATHTLSATGGGSVTVATDTIWDTKGDLAVGTGADTAAKLIAGANDTMLMADSAQTTGLKWGTPSTVRTALGLVIGTNVQAWDADLDALAALTGTNNIYYRSAANTWTTVTFSGLTFASGILTATGAVPTGTGFYHVTSGAMDSASVGETGTGSVVRATGPTISGGLYFQTANNTNCIYGHRFTDTSPTGSFLAFADSTDTNPIWNVNVNGNTTVNLDANNLTGLTIKRKTNTSPTGNFIDCQSATPTSLFRVDITGTLQVGAIPEARINYTDPNINAIRIWDDTDNAITNAVIGSGLTYTHATHTLSASGGTGTVTNAANLANNAVVLGDAGTVGVKTTGGITTDGAGVLTLGVSSTAGGLAIKNTNNSAITIVRGGVAAPSYTLTLPEGNNDNLVGRQSTDTLLNKTLEGALIGDSTSPGFTMRNAGNALTTVNPSANVSAVTLTLPITTTTLVGKDTTDILTSKTLEGAVLGDSTSQGFLMKNATSQTTTVLPTSSGTPTITLPSATTTLLGSTATGMQTFLTTPSSANFLATITDETGSGLMVFNNSPTFITPALGTPASGVLTNCTGLPGSGLVTNARLRTVGFTVDGGGSAIATGKVKGFYTCPFSGSITAWNVTADTGTCTIKTWKIATGTAKPTNANSINTSGVSLATGTTLHSTTLSDFTSTTVTANDIFAFEITAVASATEISFNLEITI